MSEPINFCDDKSSLNADKTKFPTKNGLLSLLGETCEESCLQSTLVPRQRFLLAFVSKQSVSSRLSLSYCCYCSILTE